MATKAKQPNPDPPKKKAAAKVKVVAGKPEEIVTGKKPGKTAAAKKAAEESELVRKFNEWTVKIGEKTDQHYDNQPLRVLKAFPKMNGGEVTETHLTTHLWWWRRANEEGAESIFRHEGVPHWTQILFSIYQDHFERSAYLYELRARFKQRYAWDFDHPWIYCSRQQRQMLDCLWPNPYPAQNWLPSEAGRPEWVRLGEFTVNLSLNDSVHVDQFVGELKRWRSRQGISAPTAGQGVRRKRIAWRTIELLDIRRYKLHTLNDSNRSQVSKALKAYKIACRKANIKP